MARQLTLLPNKIRVKLAFFRKDAAKRFINSQIPKRQTDCKPRYFHTLKRSKRHGYPLAKRLRTDRKTAPSTGKTKNEAADKQEKMIVTASKVQNEAAKEQWQAKKMARRCKIAPPR